MSRITAILFDLDNVVVEVDFHERWSEDEAYRAHETGDLGFEGYVAGCCRVRVGGGGHAAAA